MRRADDLHTAACGSKYRALKPGIFRSDLDDARGDLSRVDGGVNQQRSILLHVSFRLDINPLLDSSVSVRKESYQRRQAGGGGNDCFKHKNPPVIDEGCVRTSDSMARGDIRAEALRPSTKEPSHG